MAAPAFGQSFMTNVVVWLGTNTANSVTSWVNDGTASPDFFQNTGAKQPTYFGTGYSFTASSYMTGVFANVAAEESAITISLWFRPRALADTDILLCNFNGSANPGIQIYYDGGNRVGVGVRSPPNYNYKYSAVNSVMDTNHFYHLVFRYSLANGPQVLGFLDLAPMNDVLFGATNNPLSAGASDFAINSYSGNGEGSGSGRCEVQDIRMWTNLLSVADIGELFTNGANYYSPPAGPAPANEDNNYRAAASWLKATQ